MRFGAAKEITTPPFKMKLACSGKMDVDYEDIYDDMYARCLVFDNGENKFLLMSFDLLFHDRSLNDAMAEYASQKAQGQLQIRNQQKDQRWICRGTEE